MTTDTIDLAPLGDPARAVLSDIIALAEEAKSLCSTRLTLHEWADALQGIATVQEQLRRVVERLGNPMPF